MASTTTAHSIDTFESVCTFLGLLKWYYVRMPNNGMPNDRMPNDDPMPNNDPMPNAECQKIELTTYT
jgi:hypothetical protein